MTWARSGNAATERSRRAISTSRGGVLEHGEAEGRFGDEQIAFDQLEGLGGAVGEALVVAGDDDALAAVFHQHLGGAEDVAGGMERDGDAVDVERLAEGQFLPLRGGVLAVAGLHDGDGVGRRQHGAVAGAGVIGVAVGDDGAGARLRRVDEDIDGGDAEVSLEEGLGHGFTPTQVDANLWQQKASGDLAVLAYGWRRSEAIRGPRARRASKCFADR